MSDIKTCVLEKWKPLLDYTSDDIPPIDDDYRYIMALDLEIADRKFGNCGNKYIVKAIPSAIRKGRPVVEVAQDIFIQDMIDIGESGPIPIPNFQKMIDDCEQKYKDKLETEVC